METSSSTCPTEVHDDCLGIAPLFSRENTIETPVLAACSIENAHEQAPPCFSHESTLQPLTHQLPPHVVLPDVSSEPPPLNPDSHLYGNLLKVSHYEIPLTTMALLHVQTPDVSKGSDNTALHVSDPQPILGPRTGYKPSFRPILWLMVLLVSLLIVPVCTEEYDETGKKITFFPYSLMIATNPRPLIFFNDTKLVSIHADLQVFPRGTNPAINITCDLAQTAFYKKVLASVRGIQRTTHHLYSFQGITNLLECDSFLRRFYQYSTGVPSQLFCPTRHYANNLHECKQWACASCHVISPEELAWLRARTKRSPFVCHMGFFGLFRAFYTLVTKHSCETQTGPSMISVLRETAMTMATNQQLTHVINGKITYIIKITDLLSTKVKQLISSICAMDSTFDTWSQQVNKQFTKEHCHYHANMEFISHYSLPVNRAMSAMLRLTEIQDILRQLSHLTRKTLISFADLPRFLTMDLNVCLAAIPSLVHTLDALKSGFAAVMQPLVDYEFDSNKKLRLNILFTLPEISSTKALCTIEQLLPITYQNNGHCFGGPITRDDLLLLTCAFIFDFYPKSSGIGSLFTR